ncbi:hypothetical protein JL720_13664 [Aureococcus anophagefferens]|nr:hypothetical protein JL720_13664 [Aureococcus anophagefferens]
MPARRPAPDAMDTEDAPLTAAEKFQALLRPIKDVALAFDVDVDEALEECGSAVVYGRKVDGLHGVVYKVLENLRTGKAQADAAGRDAAATKVAEASGEDEFGRRYDAGPLARVVDVTPGKTVDLDVDKEESKRKKARAAPADPMVALLFRDVEEDAPFFGAAFGADGGLRLPGSAAASRRFARRRRAPPAYDDDYEAPPAFDDGGFDDGGMDVERPPSAPLAKASGSGASRRRGGGDDDDDYDCDDAWAAGGVARLFADPEELAAPARPARPATSPATGGGGGECFAWDDDGYDDRLGAAGSRRSEAYDAACKAHLDELGERRAKLEPVLRAQETEREPFDMLAIGRDIVARLGAKPATRPRSASAASRGIRATASAATSRRSSSPTTATSTSSTRTAPAPRPRAGKLALLDGQRARQRHEGDFENH